MVQGMSILHLYDEMKIYLQAINMQHQYEVTTFWFNYVSTWSIGVLRVVEQYNILNIHVLLLCYKHSYSLKIFYLQRYRE